jgi:predicted negative regulator of RcsB-dependent stress response
VTMGTVLLAWLGAASEPGLRNSAAAEFASYGIVGIIALGGIVFGWRVYSSANSERVALAERVTALHQRMLDQAENHKNELLKVYETVMPPLSNAVETLKEASRLIEETRRDQERRRRG